MVLPFFIYNMKVYLTLYKPVDVAFPVANTIISMFLKAGHCGLRLDTKNQTVFVHFFDDQTTITHHDPLYGLDCDSLYIGKTPFTLDYIKGYIKGLQNPGRITAVWERLLWLLSFGRYKPRHNCVYNTSLVLNHLFGLPISHGTPSQMKEMYDFYLSKTNQQHGF